MTMKGVMDFFFIFTVFLPITQQVPRDDKYVDVSMKLNDVSPFDLVFFVSLS